MTKTAVGVVAMLVALAGCAQPKSEQAPVQSPPAESKSTFVNRVWKVAESSSVAPGQLYVFLSEGSLVIASTRSTPAFGTWSGNADSLTIVEEGRPYSTEVVELTANEFRIRIHGPGEPVDIRLVPADDSLSLPARGVAFQVPAARSGRLLANEGQLRFIDCGEGGSGIRLEDLPNGEGAAIVQELGGAGRELAVLVRLEGNRLREIRYAAPEGVGCDRLPPEGDVEARGNEPFWMIHVDRSEASVRTPDEPEGVAYGEGRWTRVDGVRWRYEAQRTRASGVERLTLELTEQRCVDSMSGARYPFRAILFRDGKRWEGCALEGRHALEGTGRTP